jgi:hypothetical protein
MSQMELGEEFERAWMKTVAILITYCKLFIVKIYLMKIYCMYNITNPKSEVQ